jgi:hypothetical protein
MTRKSRQARKPAPKPARKPASKTKAAKSAKVLKPASVARPAKPAQPHPLDEYVSVAARSLALKIEASDLPEVRGHLEVILRLGAQVADFALPDETEPAPVFEA